MQPVESTHILTFWESAVQAQSLGLIIQELATERQKRETEQIMSLLRKLEPSFAAMRSAMPAKDLDNLERQLRQCLQGAPDPWEFARVFSEHHDAIARATAQAPKDW